MRRNEHKRAVDPEIVSALEDAIKQEAEIAENILTGQLHQGPMFLAARIFLGVPTLAGCNDLKLLQEVDFAMQSTGKSWSDFGYDDPETSLAESWNIVRFPTGMMERAVAYSRQNPLEYRDSSSLGYTKFLSLCAALQVMSGPESFIGSIDIFAEKLGVDRSTVCLYRKRALREGWLLEIEAAIPNKRATRFRFKRIQQT